MLLSVVIPTYGNSDLLCRCLHSFLEAGLGDALQIVVVDDGNDIPVALELERHPGLSALSLRLVRQPHRGAAAARNAGMAVAEGRFLWFVDADDRVMPDTLRCWWPRLEQLPSEVELLHTGPMLEAASKAVAEVGAIAPASAAALLRPRSACLDHTTYLISRQLLQAHPDVRYPEGHALLEDSAFVLSLLQTARCLYEAPGFRPYVRCCDSASVTAGAWEPERCQQFLPDIQWFFKLLHQFVQRHSDWPQVEALFRRYAYLYLRVLAVKGCPWPLFSPFRQQLLAAGFRPQGLKQRLVSFPLSLRVVSSLCRLLR